MKRKIFLLCMILFVEVIVFGCSSSTVKEKDIFEKVKDSDELCVKFDFEYDSMEVTKRLTQKEDRIDTIWVEMLCHNEDFEYRAEYVVTYILYNEGWKFERCEIKNSSYTATSLPNKDNIILEIEASKSVTIDEFYEQHTEANMRTYRAMSVVEEGPYLTTTYEYLTTVEFIPDLGWYVSGIETKKQENWDRLIGTWKYEEGEEEIDINIYSVQSEVFCEGDEPSAKIKMDFYSTNPQKTIKGTLSLIASEPAKTGYHYWFRAYGEYGQYGIFIINENGIFKSYPQKVPFTKQQ